MLRLLATIRKELLVLLRDRGGLAVLFLMPIAMIAIMALIQDAPFRDYQEMRIPLLLVNNDSGILGETLENGLKQSKIFKIIKHSISEDEAGKLVAGSRYEIGIVIPFNASDSFERNIEAFVSNKMGTEDTLEKKLPNSTHRDLNINVYFSPRTKKSFKVSILSSLRQFSSKLSTYTMLNRFMKELGVMQDTTENKKEVMSDFVIFNEKDAIESGRENFVLNSVQHNVPAWTIFGMFFIILSMASSLIKEREDGSYLRLLAMPGSYITVMAGKISAYLMVCLIQCVCMLMAGIYLMPLLGLPELIIGNNIPAIGIIAISCGLAATGSGILVGTIFNTHQQATTFGAVSIVILAALGGIWIPVYIMPDSIRFLSEISPLYWALSAFHDIFLGYGTVRSILPYAVKLLLFFGATVSISHIINKNKSYK